MQKVTDPALLAELNGGGASSPVPSVAPTQQPAPAPIAAPRGRPGIIFPAAPKAPDPYRVRQDLISNERADAAAARAAAAEARAAAKFDEERAAGLAAKASEGERKTSGFLKRALDAERQYRQVQSIGPRSLPGQYFSEMLPNVTNVLSSSDRQRAEAAQLSFISSVLRYDSGAAIPENEITEARRRLFPMPGDGPEVIQQKEQARYIALQGLRDAAGRMGGDIDIDGALHTRETANPDDEDGAVPPPQAETSNFAITENKDALGPGQRFAYDENGRPIGILNADGSWESAYGVIDDNASEREARELLRAYGDEGYAEGGVAGLNRGITLGWSDELFGVSGGINNVITGQGSFGEGYRRERDVERVAQDISREKAGVLPELTGGLFAPAGVFSQAKNVGQFVRQGAGIGAFAGAGEGEGLPGTIGGAAIGGGIGAGGGAVIGKAAPYAEPLVANVANRMRGAADRISGRAAKEARAERAWELGEAGARQDVPIRRADIDPTNLAHKRGVAKTTEKGNSIIRQADADDLAAVEAATLKLGDGSAARDAFEHGARAQAVLTRQGKHTKDEAQRLYGIAEELTDGTRFAPRQAVATLNDEITRLEGEGADAALITYLRRQEALLRRPEGWTPMQLHAFRAKLRSNLNTAGVPVEAGELPMIRAIDAASGDLQRALQGADPRALQAVQRADAIWKERAAFRREVGDMLFGRDKGFSPDQTARALDAMARTDSKRLARFVREMTPDEAADLRATYAAQLGRDRQGNFSLAHFLTQTEGKGALATPRSMKLLLGDDGMRAIADLRIIAKAKQAAASETNHSKTGNAVSTVGRGLRTLLFAGIGNAAGGPAGAVVAPAASNWFSGVAAARAARLVTNPDFTRWLKYAPQTNNPAVIDRYFDKLNKIAARDSVFLMDAQALQDYLRAAVSQSPMRAAAEGQQEQDRR